MMHHGFNGFVSDAAHRIVADPYTAMNVLDDLVGPSNARMLFPLVAFSAARAQRGEKLATLASGAAWMTAMPTIGLMAGKAITIASGGPVSWAANFVGTVLLTTKPGEVLQHSAYRGIRYLQTFDRRQRRLQMGGNYKDSETNRALRMSGIQEMSAALGASRRYLGNEAALLHQ
jgi:hypothetical protein